MSQIWMDRKISIFKLHLQKFQFSASSLRFWCLIVPNFGHQDAGVKLTEYIIAMSCCHNIFHLLSANYSPRRLISFSTEQRQPTEPRKPSKCWQFSFLQHYGLRTAHIWILSPIKCETWCKTELRQQSKIYTIWSNACWKEVLDGLDQRIIDDACCCLMHGAGASRLACKQEEDILSMLLN
jgi:hypothetical protein